MRNMIIEPIFEFQKATYRLILPIRVALLTSSHYWQRKRAGLEWGLPVFLRHVRTPLPVTFSCLFHNFFHHLIQFFRGYFIAQDSFNG